MKTYGLSMPRALGSLLKNAHSAAKDAARALLAFGTALALGAGVAAPAAAAPSGDGWLSAIDAAKGAASGQRTEPRHVRVRLAAENDALTPQAENRLAVVFEHEAGWHTYWKNPGEAGLPPEFTFTLPPGFKATAPAFPLPERLLTGNITSFGYGGETAFPLRVEIPRSAGTSGSVRIRLHVEYLACRDMCVPESADAELRLPLRVSAKPGPDAALIGEALKRIPETPASAESLRAVIDGTKIRIDELAGLPVKRSLDFFPSERNVVNYAEAPVFETRAAALSEADGQSSSADVTLERAAASSLYIAAHEKFANAPTEAIEGILVADGGPAAGGWAIEASIPLEAGEIVPPAAPRSAAASSDAGAGAAFADRGAGAAQSLTTLSALVFAFAGGLILNLMPCVFPVLSLKLLQLIGGAQRGERLLGHGLAFTSGSVLTMAVLSGVLLALRAMGGALGWGFQLQSPWVVALLILLFGAITMNLAGLFEFTAGSRVADAKVLRDAPKTGLASSFLTGVLAVIVASPCTAPFMGAALGYALTQPAIEALLVFVALGLGMSMPWLLLCVFPQWAKRLPKPGPWMETFRKIMAVPMAAAVIWLGAQQAGRLLRHACGRLRSRCDSRLLLAPRTRAVGARAQPPGHGCHGDSRGGFRRGGEPRDVRACGPHRCRGLAALERSGRRIRTRAGPTGLCRLHGRVVRYVSGQQACRTGARRSCRTLQRTRLRAPHGRLDEPRSRDHIGSRSVRPQRRATLPHLPPGRRC